MPTATASNKLRISNKDFTAAKCVRRDDTDTVATTAHLNSIKVNISGAVNSIIGGILNDISLNRKEILSARDTVTLLNDIERAALRAKDLSQYLYTISTQATPEPACISIAPLLITAADDIFRDSPVTCKLALPEDLWPVAIAAEQFKRIAANLLTNAEQSMTHGRVSVSARNVTGNNAGQNKGQTLNFVRISIRDRGSGISAEHRSRIFNPFFTTRPQGNGLGLAVVYSLVVKNGGHINVESTPDKGSTFSIVLPAVKND